jgi:hypothetical protein
MGQSFAWSRVPQRLTALLPRPRSSSVILRNKFSEQREAAGGQNPTAHLPASAGQLSSSVCIAAIIVAAHQG